MAPAKRSKSQCLENIRSNINDYRLSFDGSVKRAEEFLEQLADCYESCNAPDDLWLQSIRRVLEGRPENGLRITERKLRPGANFREHLKSVFLELGIKTTSGTSCAAECTSGSNPFPITLMHFCTFHLEC